MALSLGPSKKFETIQYNHSYSTGRSLKGVNSEDLNFRYASAKPLCCEEKNAGIYISEFLKRNFTFKSNFKEVRKKLNVFRLRFIFSEVGCVVEWPTINWNGIPVPSFSNGFV